MRQPGRGGRRRLRPLGASPRGTASASRPLSHSCWTTRNMRNHGLGQGRQWLVVASGCQEREIRRCSSPMTASRDAAVPMRLPLSSNARCPRSGFVLPARACNRLMWAVRGRRCPALAPARNGRFCGDVRSCPAAAHLECGPIARSKRGDRGGTGDLGPCRPGPTPAEPSRGSANVKTARGKGNRKGNRRGSGTGRRPRETNRRPPDEGKPEEGRRRGRTRRANGIAGGKPAGETGGRAVRPQTTR
jgi:hypothetical protein